MKVTVENFQSIKHAEIEIEGFTVITGSNNSGKTALMRAIKGAFQNTPGTSFVRHGEDNCRVEIEFDDASFAWEKGKKKPTYEVGGKSLNPGKDVPHEVANLGVAPITAGGQLIWPQIAPQFTGQVFLVDKPGSVLAEAVADVERVGKLNRALKSAESDKRSASSEVRVRRKDLKTYEDELSSFEGLVDVAPLLEDLEETSAKVAKIAAAIKGLHSLSVRLQKARATLDELSGVESLEVPSRESISEIVQAGTDCKQVQSLMDRLDTARTQNADLSELSKVLKTVPSDFTDLGSDVQTVGQSVLAVERLQESLAKSQNNVRSLHEELTVAITEHQTASDEVTEILGGMDKCPTCGAPPNDHRSHEVTL